MLFSGAEAGDAIASSDDFTHLANPKAMGICSSAAVVGGFEAVAFRAKENSGLIMDGQEHLDLSC